VAVGRRQYRFLTTWLLESPREPVFDLLWDSARWPEWWPGVVEATEFDPGRPGAGGIGRRGRYEWRSFVPYPVRFEVVATRIERPALLEGEATGELEGVGRWRLFEQQGATAVLYEWNVRTTKRWMNLIGPVAAPVFRWNHDYVMRGGGSGIARELGVRLLASS
jgi:hypothetical protein